jgi:hypothetical protein
MKNQSQKIEELLREVYQIDHSLSRHEKELKKIISHLLETRPDAIIDDALREKLRNEIMARIEKLKEEKEKKFNIASIFSLGTPAYAIAGSLVVVLFVSGIYFSQNSNNSSFGGVISFNKIQENGFGKLTDQSANNIPQTEELGAGLTPAPSETTKALSDTQVANRGGGGDNSEMAVMPPFELTNYRYIYDGNEIVLEGNFVNVLKRTKGENSASSVAKMIKGVNLGLINLGALGNSKAESITLYQDKDRGYSVYLGFYEGMISIYKNWRTWENQSRCLSISSTRCEIPVPNPLTPNDVPNDEVLIEIANDFIGEFGINTKIYGKPEVSQSWRAYVGQVEYGDISVPEEIQVVYPLIIDGQKVYESYGEISGLTVSVDIRNKQVASIYNLSTQNYDRSSYKFASVSDILSLTERGGMNNYYYSDQANKAQGVKLGGPERVYMKYWKYDNITGISDELLVPALNFPVKDFPQNADYNLKRNVIVPLVDELVNQTQPDYPTPLLEKSAQ